MFEVISDLGQVHCATNEILSRLKQLNLSEELSHDIRLSFEEALINAIKHGNKFNKDLKVEWNLMITETKIIINVKDQGQGYNYKCVPNPTLNVNLTKCAGRGVFLIKKLMDKVYFNENGNEIIMEKIWRKQ